MITQTYVIVCDGATPSDPPSKRCDSVGKVDETTLFHAARAFAREGWYVAENAKTYCPDHADNARGIDRDMREKPRSS